MPDAARRAFDGAHRRLEARRGQIGHLQLRDLLDLRARHLARPSFLFGSPEPFSMPAARLSSTDAGGVLVMKVNERSA